MGIFYFLANFNEYQSYETHYVTMRVMTIHINIIIIPRLMSKRLNGAFQMGGENEPFQGTKSQDRPHPQNQQRKCGVTNFKALSVLSVGSESFFPLLLYYIGCWFFTAYPTKYRHRHAQITFNLSPLQH